MDTLYTISEAAAIMNVHRATMYRWIRAGKLRAINIGPTEFSDRQWWRVHKQELERIRRAVTR